MLRSISYISETKGFGILTFPYYRILGVVIPFMLGLPNVDELWFQCDGASIHRSLETVTAMHQLWDRNRVICRSCDRSRNSRPPIEDFAQNWSAHSPDLAPCDQFLYGFMKGKILIIFTLFSPFLKKTHIFFQVEFINTPGLRIWMNFVKQSQPSSQHYPLLHRPLFIFFPLTAVRGARAKIGPAKY